MRLKTLLTSILFMAAVLTASAQRYNIKAQFVDSKSGEGVEFATVSITPAGSDKVLTYTLTDGFGNFELKGVKGGKYLLKSELLGYDKFSQEITLEKDVDMGKLKMAVQVNFLEGAMISDVGNPIVMKKDTVEFNATSFKTTDNDMLEDLLKKLPGVEVDTDGTITSNGKTISKITIDGKTFFLDDPQLASKNIPAKIINKVKVVEKKSEQAEFTGIDDGNEETVIDLSVMKGMMNGWFGNVSGGGGSDVRSASSARDNDFRFQGGAMVANFSESNQISIIANANNTNNRGFRDLAGSMMQGMRGGGPGMGQGGAGMGFPGNGISTSYMGGANASHSFGFDGKSELAGNYLFNANEKAVEESTFTNTLRADGTRMLSDQNGTSFTNTYGHRAGGRFDWRITKNTSILFSPQFNLGSGNFREESDFYTDNADAESNVTSHINKGKQLAEGENHSKSASGFFLLRQRLGKPGRTVSLSINYNLSNNVIDGHNQSNTDTFDESGALVADNNPINQTYNQQAKATAVGGRLSYTEPLGGDFFVEGTYSYNYSRNNSEKETVDVATGERNEMYSNKIINTYNNQRMGVNLMRQKEKYNITIGMNAQPYHQENETTTNGKTTPIVQKDLNWAPSARIDYNFSETSMLRIRYRGQTTQPTMTQLQPVEDNSNPLSIVRGNPNLHPSFSHSLMTMWFNNNREKFSSIHANLDLTYNQNNIVNATWISDNGVTYKVPMNNELGTFRANGRLMFNSPIKKSKFSVMSHTDASYQNSMSFVGKAGIDGENPESYLDINNFDPNRYTALSASERFRFTYRDDHVELTLGGRVRYSQSWYQMTTTEPNAAFTNTVDGSVNYTTNNKWSFVTDGRYTFYKGYNEGYNTPSFVWNAEINKQIFKGRATVALRCWDILNQSRNTYRTTAENYYQDVSNNTLGRYIILSLTYRFGTFGDKGNRMMGPGGPHGHGPMGPPRF